MVQPARTQSEAVAGDAGQSAPPADGIRISGSASADLRDLSRRSLAAETERETLAPEPSAERAVEFSRALLCYIMRPLMIVSVGIGVFELAGLDVEIGIAVLLAMASFGLAAALWLLREHIGHPNIGEITVSRAAALAAILFAANAGVHWAAAAGSPGSHAFPVAVAFCVSLIPSRRARAITALGLLVGCALSWFAMAEPVPWFSLVSSFVVGLLLAVGVNQAASDVLDSWMKRAAEKLELQRERYDVMLSTLHDDHPQRVLEARGEMDGLWEWNLKTDQIYFSPRWRALLGYGDHGQTAKPDVWFNLVHPYDLDELMGRLAAHLDGNTAYFECEHRIRQADGSYRWVLSHGRLVLDSEGRPERLAGSQIDIKRMKKYEAQLVHEATHDRLTGLANRQQLLEQLEQDFMKSRRLRNYRFAAAFLDLDRFKYVNDTLGHMVGDELLKVVGERLRRVVRANDLVSRLGGDEFVVLMRGIRDPEEALALATRVRDAVATNFQIGPHQISTAASVGVAVSNAEMSNAGEILGWADIAMYEAKSRGNGHVQSFDAEMHQAASYQFLLQNELARAIEKEEFELHYQPIVSSIDGAIVGVEALIRWRKSDGELVFPGQFISVAEDTGLIVPIGKWVFRTACLQVRRWIAEGLRPVKISVNFAAKQLADATTTEFVRETLEETGVDPQMLQVEITESDLVSNRQCTPESLDRLKLLGVETAIDDFGTGYSSLSYLRQLNCSVLKIDQSFVRDLHIDQRASALARSVIDMAHNLGLGVVAEGVETAEQLELLREFGCDLIQGYLVCRAKPADELRDLIRKGKIDFDLVTPPKSAVSEISSSGEQTVEELDEDRSPESSDSEAPDAPDAPDVEAPNKEANEQPKPAGKRSRSRRNRWRKSRYRTS